MTYVLNMIHICLNNAESVCVGTSFVSEYLLLFYHVQLWVIEKKLWVLWIKVMDQWLQLHISSSYGKNCSKSCGHRIIVFILSLNLYRCGKRVGRVHRFESGQVVLGWPVFFTWIFFFFLIKKTTCICHLESHVANYFDVKYIILNSSLILRMSSAKQINICSIILKLYKSQHY